MGGSNGRGAEEADRLLGRFVRNVTRARRTARGPGAATDDATAVVSHPKRPRRKKDEVTEPCARAVEEPSVRRIARRRLLGQEELAQVMSDEERAKLLVELGVLYRHGHIADVVAELERVRRSHPFDIELHGAMADFFLDRGDLPRSVELLFGMVDAHFERRDVEAARRCLERVRAIDPENRRLRSFEKLLARRPSASDDGGGES